jgi:YVTN family beta-propeller protein
MTPAPSATPSASATTGTSAALPLVRVADVKLPGGETRFDYQELDPARNHLVVAHMNDASVLVLDLRDGSVVKELHDIVRPRGVAVGDDRIFVTSTGSVVIIDAKTLAEVARVKAGATPDGIAVDPVDHVVGVSEQHDGAVAFLDKSGSGARTLLPLGKEVGNVVFDESRRAFFAAVVNDKPPNQLVQLDPLGHRVSARIDLPGCERAHGVRIHPDGKSAFVACEDNDLVVRVALDAPHSLTTAATGKKPDVMSIDPSLGWLYVAAESGDLTVFDIRGDGLRTIDREHPADDSHSVVDPATHRVFFPLLRGPVMRIMRPQ